MKKAFIASLKKKLTMNQESGKITGTMKPDTSAKNQTNGMSAFVTSGDLMETAPVRFTTRVPCGRGAGARGLKA